MSSPVKTIMANIHHAIVQISPERESEFEKRHPSFEITYIDSAEWLCNVNTNEKRIQLSRGVVEAMWCMAYGYIILYWHIVEQQRALQSKKTISLRDDPRVRGAVELIKWALEHRLLNEEEIGWPDDLPRPSGGVDNEGENVADELCLCALAFAVHHELAHIRLNHNVRNDIELERDADYEAAKWILDVKLEESDPKFIKRSLGIATALQVMNAHEIHKSSMSSGSHPRAIERVHNTLRCYVKNRNHLIWAFLVVTTKLHLDAKMIDTPEIVYESFHDCFESYVEAISRQS